MTASAFNPATGCSCSVDVSFSLIRWGFNYPDYRSPRPIAGWQYEDSVDRLAVELGWERPLFSAVEMAMDLLRRFENAGADGGVGALLTVSQRESEEATLP